MGMISYALEKLRGICTRSLLRGSKAIEGL